ncbi:MAG: hypothetical protein GXO87_11565 [Chlorobi bacterium]|nr:hypothetical protein [Chlorobiota bacterium]
MNYFKGTIGLESNFYYMKTDLRSGFSEEQKSSQFNGAFSFESESTILHPNFLVVDLNAMFRPGTRHDNFIVAPDQAATTTAERVGARANIFNNRPLSGSFYFNYDHSFVRRDFASNIENYRRNLGAYAYYRTFIGNFNFNYNYDDWLQNEVELQRFYASKIHTLNLSVIQKFGKDFSNKLSLQYGDYYRKYTANNLIIANQTFNADLNTSAVFNFATQIRWFSLISYNKQIGYDRRNRINVNESFSSELPYNFQASANYNYSYLKVDLYTSELNMINFRLGHQLYQSLYTYAEFQYSNFQQNLAYDKTNTFQIGFDYSKSIPGGNLKLSYSYNRYDKKAESETNAGSAYNEAHQLTDGKIELLDNPFAVENSIVVTDENNILVYQRGYDYEIIDQGEYFEIRRLLGGQIPNNGTVLVSYDYLRENSYKYVSPNQHFFVGLNLFDNFLQLGFTGVEVKYNNTENVRFVVLKLISQRIYSLKLNYGGFTAGVEYDSYKSNIVPYESLRYFGQYDYLLKATALFSLIGNYKVMDLIDQNQRQKFADAVGRVMFFLGAKSKLIIEGSYRFQEGVGIDLDLLKFKTEYQMIYRAIQISVGVELYDRTYIQESRKYMNGYISIQRNI